MFLEFKKEFVGASFNFLGDEGNGNISGAFDIQFGIIFGVGWHPGVEALLEERIAEALLDGSKSVSGVFGAWTERESETQQRSPVWWRFVVDGEVVGAQVHGPLKVIPSL